MKTNDLKRGTRVRLANGWEAIIEDNLRGNTRLAKVFGYFTETGSVYAHDIVAYQDGAGAWKGDIELTESQAKLKERVATIGF